MTPGAAWIGGGWRESPKSPQGERVCEGDGCYSGLVFMRVGGRRRMEKPRIGGPGRKTGEVNLRWQKILGEMYSDRVPVTERGVEVVGHGPTLQSDFVSGGGVVAALCKRRRGGVSRWGLGRGAAMVMKRG
jgi:hypothetical protein